MCGIAGFSGEFDSDLLKKMGALIAHRGPDDQGDMLLAHANNRVGLAHQRLSIIDLTPEGRQPMTVNCECCHCTVSSAAENKLWLTYNGEIYNYLELRNELEKKGHRFYSKTDSEVLLHLYAEEGISMLKKLNGIFAFAIYDGRQDGLLLIARDGVGTKPLYYSETNSGFLFASELKSLLACREVERNLDLTAIHYYLAYLWCPGQQTALQSVKKLQPGEAMIINQGRIEKRWYYYDYPYGNSRLQISEKDICAELDGHLTQAVSRQLVADVPVGAFLSGGLDSSSIVAMMRKLQNNNSIQCYSIGFSDGTSIDGNPNDLPYAKQVARHLNVDLRIIEVEANMIKHLKKMLYHLDEPQADPAPINALLIAEAARQDGIKVLLSGAGGDDIFSGYRRHLAIHTERFWTWLPLALRKKMAAYSSAMLAGQSVNKSMQSPLVRRLAKVFAYADLSAERRLVSHFMWSTEGLRRTLYSKEMANAVQNVDTATPLLTSLQRVSNEHDPLNRMLYLEGKHFLADHNLNYTDKMAMAAGVEVRVPLLDPDLIDFATRIPTYLKQKGKIGKSIFKKTMEPYLPKDVIYRSKAGFGAPLRRWLHKELQPMLADVLSESAIKSRGIFDSKAVDQLIKLDREGRADAAYTIFSVLCIELWCKSFVDTGI